MIKQSVHNKVLISKKEYVARVAAAFYCVYMGLRVTTAVEPESFFDRWCMGNIRNADELFKNAVFYEFLRILKRTTDNG